ncbi:MAG: NADH-quinone oxidoreductase subunit C [Nitrospinaceae bacterium]
MSATGLIDKVRGKFGGEVLESHDFRGDQTVTVNKQVILELAEWLKNDAETDMNFLMDLTCVDYYESKPVRFEVVYHFYSLQHNHRLRIKCPVAEDDAILDSLTPLYASSDWYEREVWDLYGVKFQGHPNLKRILLYEGFKGHPLRKDYPINKRQPLIGPMN